MTDLLYDKEKGQKGYYSLVKRKKKRKSFSSFTDTQIRKFLSTFEV